MTAVHAFASTTPAPTRTRPRRRRRRRSPRPASSTTRSSESGNWVFVGGLQPLETSTVVDGRGDEVDRHRRGVHREQGVPRRLLGHRGRRPRRGAQARGRGVEGVRRSGRRAPLPERMSTVAGPPRADRSDLPRGVRPGRGLARPALRRSRPRRGRRGRGPAHRAWRSGRPTASRPIPGGWLTTTATHRAIDRIRRESAARHQAPGGPDDHRRHTARAHRTGRGRPAPADLHLLPPRPRGRGAGGSDPATARRPDRRARSPAASSFPRPPWLGASPAPRPRSRPRTSRSASPTAATSPIGSARCWRSSTWCSTRATSPAPATTRSART